MHHQQYAGGEGQVCIFKKQQTFMISIAIVEDQQMFRQALTSLLNSTAEYEVVFACDTAEQFLNQLESRLIKPDIVIVDVSLPQMNGLELCELIADKYAYLKSIVLSIYDQERLIAKIIGAGASAFLNKNCDFNELVQALNNVSKNQFYINTQTLKALQQKSRTPEHSIKGVGQIPIELTNREIEIIILICKELSSLEIANKLFISTRTVEGHRNRLLLKTGCRNTAGLVLFAVKYHIFEVL